MTTLSVALVTALAGFVVPASASPAPVTTSVITLVTGDQVHVTGDKVAVRPGPGRGSVSFLQETGAPDVTIVPSDAGPLLAAGRLDRRLFNISELIRQGFAGVPELPLIVTGARPAQVQVARSLASIDAVAVRASAALWTTALAGDTKIWLDGRARPVLDQSTTQVGAVTAWQAGITGKGVTIADLDGGWDPAHPDLSGVAEAVDFTGTGIADGYGHGTHTASTIAGTGAASGGKYRGVAPDARLLVGKVCEDSGGCPESAIIAGMEWAAAKGAVAVNLSLGGSPTDGTDPMSLAVNRLTAQHGTLFVIAAGNSGAGETVGSPGAADAALTVGSVTKSDALSSFSSRGPRVGDFAVKPDIAAPGSAIVAARARGTAMGTPVNDFYTSANGTSMATPHVTGAVALLKQAHPAWSATELKAALMNSAYSLGLSIYASGAGRLDVARALRQEVRSAPASVSFPFYSWPYAGGVTRTVTYTNDGAAPVELALSLDSHGGLFSLNTTKIVVPARGSASVDVAVRPTVASGQYSSVLVASGDSVVVRTPVGVTLEEEKYTLTVDAIGRAGVGVWFSTVNVVNTETGLSAGYFFADADNRTVRIPKGRYDVHSITYGLKGGTTVLSQPDLRFDRDQTVTLDTRTAVPMQAHVDRQASTEMFLIVLNSGNASRQTGVGLISSVGGATFAAATKPVTGRKFLFLYQPVLVDSSKQHAYNLMFYRDGAIPDPAGFVAHDRDLARVRATYQTHGNAPTRAVRGGYAYLRGVAANVTVLLDMPVPSTRTEYYTPGPDVGWDSMLGLRGESGTAGEYQISPRKTYAKRWYSTRWNQGPIGPALGSYVDGWGLSREGDAINASIPLFSTAGDWSYTTSWTSSTKALTTLSRDGREVARAPWAGWISAAAPEAGVYTLATSAERVAPWSPLATSVSGTWTFRAPAATAAKTALPLLVVRASGSVDSAGVAPSGRPFVLDLTVARQRDATYGRIGTPRLEVSYDDGVTWRRAPVVGSHALLFHPPGKAFVSLRSSVTDSLGNSASHTVMRAYQVAP